MINWLLYLGINYSPVDASRRGKEKGQKMKR